MLRGYVLRYLSVLAAGRPIPDAWATAPVALRWLVIRRARGLLIAAALDIEHAADLVHVARLAYLAAKGELVVDENAVDAVRALYEAKRDETAENRAFARFGVVLALTLALSGLVVAGVIWVVREARRVDPPPVLAETVRAPVEEREPEPEHPLIGVFRDRLPAYCIALDRRSAGAEDPPPLDVATARTSVLQAARQTDPNLVEPLTTLLDAAELFSAASEGDTSAAWLAELARFHDALEGQRVPFYVDATLLEEIRTGRQRVLMSTYRVQARRTFRSGDRSVKQLDLVRLDTLNHGQSLLGYTRPEARHALVLADRIEEFLVSQLLVSAHSADESVFVRGYEDERGTEWVTRFEQAAHEDLRAEATRVVRDARVAGSASLATLATAVMRRRRAILDVSYELRALGIELREPLTYAYEVSRLDEYRAQAGPARIAAVRESELALSGASVTRAYEVLADAHRLSVAEHEVQHRLDYESDRLVQIPGVLAAYTGVTESEDHVNRIAESANAELSAYLSQVARQPVLAKTELIHVASFVMNRDAWGTAESYAALAIFEALADALDVPTEPLVEQHRIVRARVAAIYDRLRALDGPALAALASRAWSSLYGEPIPELVLAE